MFISDLNRKKLTDARAVTKRNPNKPPEVKPFEILEVLTPDEKKRIKADRDPKATNSEDIMLDPRGLSVYKPTDGPQKRFLAPDADAARRENAFRNQINKRERTLNLNKGGSVKSSASSRADGIAQRGKTRGRNY